MREGIIFMCGIAGMINNSKTREQQLGIVNSLLPVQHHRGPDNSGYYCAPGAVLIHNRLAVIDVEKGAQPMQCRHNGENYALVYNGELYNSKEVKTLLAQCGWKFSTSSDTELVLKSYIQWGADCLQRFNGIFAFAVWEENAHRLFAARDRMGVKPFFYAFSDDGGFCFASEIKAVLAADGIKAEVDRASLSEIMLIGPARTPGCGIFKGVSELKMGQCGMYENGKFSVWDYWDVKPQEHTDSFEETVEKVRFLVTDSITRQTVSDVPICCFLSGGLDSSAICSIAAQNIPNLKTFSVEYRDNEKYFHSTKFQPDSDDEYIAEMVRYLGSEHHHVVIDTPQLGEALYAAVEARDLPGMADIDSSLLLFCREMKKYSTVALSGECADEIFGGYPWYRDKDIRMTDGFPWSQSTSFRASLMRDEIIQDLDTEKFVHDKYLFTTSKVKDSGGDPLEKRMKEMMRLNLEWFMQTLLDRKDRMSMSCGLEVRVPFCDHRIVEYLYNVPWEFKDYNGREKGLLRYALEGALPQKVLWRKKSPYPKTHNPSYEKWCRDRLSEIINDSGCRLTEVVKKEKVADILNGGAQGVQWYGQLMNAPQIMAYLIQIDHWLRKYRITITD